MRKNLERFFILIIFLNLIVACVTTRIIRYETIYREPKPSNFPIDIYESSNLNRPYKVIGIVTANAGKWHSTQDTIEQLKKVAREMGGEALMDLGFATSDGRIIQRTATGYVSGSARENWGAKVIVWEK
jgi:hypothetical protein